MKRSISPVRSLLAVALAMGWLVAHLADRGEAIAEGQPIAAEHQVAGSRIRMSGPMALKADLHWQDRMAPAAQRQVERITAGRMRRYGYL